MPKTDRFLQNQYDRFISQLREEVKELFWLYNFFFAIESALLGLFVAGKIESSSKNVITWAGLTISIFWLVINFKQKKLRDEWIEKIQSLEVHMGNQDQLTQMWPKLDMDWCRKICRQVFGGGGIWNLMLLLPLSIAAMWILILKGKI